MAPFIGGESPDARRARDRWVSLKSTSITDREVAILGKLRNWRSLACAIRRAAASTSHISRRSVRSRSSILAIRYSPIRLSRSWRLMSKLETLYLAARWSKARACGDRGPDQPCASCTLKTRLKNEACSTSPSWWDSKDCTSGYEVTGQRDAEPGWPHEP